MEHDVNVYVCRWSESDDGFKLWVKSRPRVRGYGSTYAEAEQSLLEALWDKGGAIPAVLEYIPPLPKYEFQQSTPSRNSTLSVATDRSRPMPRKELRSNPKMNVSSETHGTMNSSQLLVAANVTHLKVLEMIALSL